MTKLEESRHFPYFMSNKVDNGRIIVYKIDDYIV